MNKDGWNGGLTRFTDLLLIDFSVTEEDAGQDDEEESCS